MSLRSLGPIEGDGLRYTDLATPEPSAGQVLLRVAACGVCRSNLHMIEGDWESLGIPARLPIVPGHEVTGTVVACGPGTDSIPIGTNVGVQPIWSTCGACSYCLTGREQLCERKQVTGESLNGGYAEYMLARASHTYPLPDELDPVQAAPLFCPGLTAFAAVRKASVGPGDSLAVLGVGGVGHMAIQFAALAGAEVTAVSRSRAHLELAETLGATHLMDPAGPVTQMVDATTVFAPSTEVLSQALRITRPGGTIVVCADAEVHGFAFAKEHRVVGSLLGNRDDMNTVLQLAARGRIHAVSDRYPLDEATVALGNLKRGSTLARTVLIP